MSGVRRLLLVVLAVAVTVGLAGAPASAQTKVRKDKARDAPSVADIRSVKVQNNARSFAYTVRVARLVRTRTLVSVGISVPTKVEDLPDSSSVIGISTVPTPSGRFSTSIARVDLAPGANGADITFTDVSCPGVRTRARGGRGGFVRVVVPQSCLGDVAGRNELNLITADLDDLDDDERSSLVGARRGDEPSDLPVDLLGSAITTRRG